MDNHLPTHHIDNQRALNTQENAVKAIATARANVVQLKAGPLWNHRAPRGELEIKGALLLDGAAVAGVRFSPDNGSVLPKGLHPIGGHNPAALAQAEKHLNDMASNLSVLEGAEFREPESCWAVPLAYAGRIVADLRVSGSGATIVPDRKLQEELGNSSLPRP